MVNFHGKGNLVSKIASRAQDHLDGPDAGEIVAVIGMLDLYGAAVDRQDIDQRLAARGAGCIADSYCPSGDGELRRSAGEAFKSTVPLEDAEMLQEDDLRQAAIREARA